MRAFIAVDIPGDIKDLLETAGKQFIGLDLDSRLVKRHQYHLTLNFLGDIQERMADTVIEVIKKITASQKPFFIELSGWGVFPNFKKPSVLWIGVAEGRIFCEGLSENISADLIGFGLAPEKKKFIPHLTMARFKSDRNAGCLYQAMKENRIDLPKMRFQADHMTLYKSTLAVDGAVYEAIARQHFKID